VLRAPKLAQGVFSAVAFLVGALTSIASGFLGMKVRNTPPTKEHNMLCIVSHQYDSLVPQMTATCRKKTAWAGQWTPMKRRKG
jgi:hypothetical protein